MPNINLGANRTGFGHELGRSVCFPSYKDKFKRNESIPKLFDLLKNKKNTLSDVLPLSSIDQFQVVHKLPGYHNTVEPHPGKQKLQTSVTIGFGREPYQIEVPETKLP
jgi:hypothetical protein